MKVTLNLNAHGDGNCTVTREPGDPRFHGIRNAAGESRLLYHMKKELAKQGYDFVKKRMWKDGHMMDEMQQYLRERKGGKNSRCLAIYNGNWAINGADKDFNEGEAVFIVENIGEAM